MHKCCEKL